MADNSDLSNASIGIPWSSGSSDNNQTNDWQYGQLIPGVSAEQSAINQNVTPDVQIPKVSENSVAIPVPPQPRIEQVDNLIENSSDKIDNNSFDAEVPDVQIEIASEGISTKESVNEEFSIGQHSNAFDNKELELVPSGLGWTIWNVVEEFVKEGLITQAQSELVKTSHIETGRDVVRVLLDDGLVNKSDIRRVQAKLSGITPIDLGNAPVVPEALSFLQQSLAEKFRILPLSIDPKTNLLSVAMADPLNLDTIQFVEKKTRCKLIVHWADEDELIASIKERYTAGLNTDVNAVLKDTDINKVKSTVSGEKKVLREDPIPKIVSKVLADAVGSRASDIHIEPLEGKTRIRFRIDGILTEKLVLPSVVHDALVSRIKILSDLKIDERRLPQDGRFNYHDDSHDVDLRVSTLPTVHGEKIVMRLLKKNNKVATFADLGLRGRALKNLEEAILHPHGILLVTGPTGSGKTTTLYSVLTKLNSPRVNIMTLEDPVEYQMQGINQVQINQQIGLTFANGLRSFLRQDPNIIMVGEIRDSETAELAIQASLTGHFVLSTLHTNSAAGSLPRLLDMGAETFLLASSMIAVLAQRVVRKICQSCKSEIDVDKHQVETLKEVLGSLYPKEGLTKIWKGEGCSECNMTGYLGRVAIYEVLPISEKIAKMILERATSKEIEDQAIVEGMVTMKQDGYLKVIEGITTIEEVLRVAET